IEAMACGCPVITTREGSIPEASGEAAYTISGKDVAEMAEAIVNIRKPEIREALIAKGLAQAAKFSWNKTANKIYDAIMTINDLKAESRQPEIAKHWHQYRELLKQIQ
nr:glycosyltransferase [Xenococcaceae cyanobacterium MO_188.B19]